MADKAKTLQVPAVDPETLPSWNSYEGIGAPFAPLCKGMSKKVRSLHIIINIFSSVFLELSVISERMAALDPDIIDLDPGFLIRSSYSISIASFLEAF